MTTTMNRQLKVIVFSDVVDSTVEMFADELIAMEQIRQDLLLLRDELKIHNGQLVKSLGDGLLITFDGPTQALEFIRGALVRLRQPDRHSLSHRFGLHTGEIYADGDDILGQGVHLASRLQTLAPVNGVAFVRSTLDLIDPRFRQQATSLGPQSMKGLPEAMEVFAIEGDQLRGTSLEHPGGFSVHAQRLASTPFELVQPIGRSDTKRTWLLRHRQQDCQAVLKLIPADAEHVDRLGLEVAALERLHHPRLPRVLDAFAHAGEFYFIQEHIPGASLKGSMDLLRRKQAIGALLDQCLELLDVLHTAGLIHGDLHPGNLIVDPVTDRFVLVDFSLLKTRVALATAASSQVDDAEQPLSETGRPFYSAPERARFGDLTPSIDLYALGVTALSLFTGQHPSRLVSPSQGDWVLDELDPEVVGWLQPLLAFSPANRVASASDARRLLKSPEAVAAPVPPLAAVTAPVPRQSLNKRQLEQVLTETYGPMVSLLLEQQPSQIPGDQVPALFQRLITAGLAETDLTSAIQLSQGAPAQSSPTVSSAPQAAPLDLGPARILSRYIGPVADLLWQQAVASGADSDRGRLQQHLEQAGVASTVVTAFFSDLDQQGTAADSATGTRSMDPPATSQAEEIDLEAFLLEQIGPIAPVLLKEVQRLPSAQQPSELLRRLHQFGLPDDLMARLVQQLEGR